MTTPESAIRARRKLTNRLIAAHDAARLRPFLDPKVTVIAGDGDLLFGAEAVLGAFAAQFRDTAFHTYERTTRSVALDDARERAAEHGDWVARWRGAQPVVLAGTYLAVWRLARGQWVIEAEVFVTLSRG
jgi:hypothetical protein